jgi:hypothetical protein
MEQYGFRTNWTTENATFKLTVIIIIIIIYLSWSWVTC